MARLLDSGSSGGVNAAHQAEKPGTGDPLHTQEPVTVASFRTWRGWREYVARDRCLTEFILALACVALTFAPAPDRPFSRRQTVREKLPHEIPEPAELRRLSG